MMNNFRYGVLSFVATALFATVVGAQTPDRDIVIKGKDAQIKGLEDTVSNTMSAVNHHKGRVAELEAAAKVDAATIAELRARIAEFEAKVK